MPWRRHASAITVLLYAVIINEGIAKVFVFMREQLVSQIERSASPMTLLDPCGNLHLRHQFHLAVFTSADDCDDW